MASHGYLSIEGKAQGLISAGCSSIESIGNRCQTDHADEIMVLDFEHNMNNSGNIKNTNHGPIEIIKLIDKSSPLLAQALANKEEIECSISFYRTASTGGQEKYYTIRIKGGKIAALNLKIPHVIDYNDAEPQELLAIQYRDITWEHHIAKTSGYASLELDTWEK